MFSPESIGVYAAGDNGEKQLWNSKFKLSPRFIKCDEFPVSLDNISQISSWNQSIAILSDNEEVYFKEEGQEIKKLEPRMLKSINCIDNTVYGLQSDGNIIDLPNNTTFNGGPYKSFAASSQYVIAIDNNDNAQLFSKGNISPKQIAENVTVVGATDFAIFYATESELYKYEDEQTVNLHVSTEIIFISCSESEALFIDKNGALYKFEIQALTRIFALPPIVFASCGIQHSAAISFDGRLYTWGFNPSGQLGIGNDRPTTEPSYVLDQVSIVACGTHHTIALRSNEPPKIPKGMDKSKLTIYPSTLPSSIGNITRAELLF